MRTLKVAYDTAANLALAGDPVYPLGWAYFETDTQKFKLADGVTPWSALAYSGTLPLGGSGGATPKKCVIRLSSGQSVVDSSTDLINFDATVADNGSMAVLASHAIKVTTAGSYRIELHLFLDNTSSAAVEFDAYLRINGTTVNQGHQRNAASKYHTVTFVFFRAGLVANDLITATFLPVGANASLFGSASSVACELRAFEVQ